MLVSEKNYKIGKSLVIPNKKREKTGITKFKKKETLLMMLYNLHDDFICYVILCIITYII